jgi:hypothetical protein
MHEVTEITYMDNSGLDFTEICPLSDDRIKFKSNKRECKGLFTITIYLLENRSFIFSI